MKPCQFEARECSTQATSVFDSGQVSNPQSLTHEPWIIPLCYQGLNNPFTWMTHLRMTHSLKWPICMQRWNVCLPLLSKQYHLKLQSFRCNKMLEPLLLKWLTREMHSGNFKALMWKKSFLILNNFLISRFLCSRFSEFLSFYISRNMEIQKFESPQILKSCMFAGRHVCM